MKIIHRISGRVNESQLQRIQQLGVKYNLLLGNLASFDFEEGNDQWPEVQALMKESQPIDIIRTKFSRSECLKARYLSVEPTGHYGYPKPENGYLETVYDVANYCAHCGMGLRQERAFSMRAEPKWGQKRILQLNWVFDEYFVHSEVWQSVFRPLGVEARPVLKFRAGSPLESVVQLKVPADSTTGALGLGDHPFEECTHCGRRKYLPLVRGMIPPLDGDLRGHIGKTLEYFGSGASAFREVLISLELFRALDAQGVKGVSFKPLTQ